MEDVNNDFKELFKIDLDYHNEEKMKEFKENLQEHKNNFLKSLENFDIQKIFDNFIKKIEDFYKEKRCDAKIILENNDDDIEKACKQIQIEIKYLFDEIQEKLSKIYNYFFKSVNDNYCKLLNYLKLNDGKDDNNEELSMDFFTNQDINTQNSVISSFTKGSLLLGASATLAIITGAFPPSAFVTFPAILITSIISGKSLADAIGQLIWKDERLKEALNEAEKIQIENFKDSKNSFLKNFNENKKRLKIKANNEIDRKIFILSAKGDTTKKFVNELKIDYEKLYNSMKTLYNI